MNSGPKVTRIAGHCQLCEKLHKLTDDRRMVHHGYERPGDGEIHGDCPGVHQEPYQLSCEAIKPWLTGTKARLTESKKRLAQIDRGQVTHFERTTSEGYGWNQHLVTRYYARFVTDVYRFDRALDLLKAETEQSVRMLGSEVKRLTKRIADWKLAPLIEVDERGQTQADRDAVAARAKVKADARKAREDKRAALKAERELKRAEGIRVLTKAGEKLRAIDLTQPAEFAVAKARALHILQDLGKKKNYSLLNATTRFGPLNKSDDPYAWEAHLGADNVLVRLGLTEGTRPDGTYWYKTQLWHA